MMYAGHTVLLERGNMLKILKDFKLPIILGSIALAAVAATAIILFGGKTETGLYITDVKGAVSVLSSNGNSESVSNSLALKEGDIITVNDDANCIVTYKGSKNSVNNYVLISRNSQVVVSSAFDGKNNGQLLLNNGSVICNQNDKDKAQIEVRTADALVYTANTITKVEYSTDEFASFTDVYTFMGNSKIQMYDSFGEKVNDAELLVSKLTGRVTTGAETSGPMFAYLNVDFSLGDLTSYDLKVLLNIAQLVTDFPYTIQEIKDAYDNSNDPNKNPDDVMDIEDIAVPEDSSDIIQTAVQVVTTVTELDTEKVHVITQDPATTTKRASETTTKAPVDTASATTTTAEATKTDTTTKETTKSSGSNNSVYYVTVIVNGDETIQEVRHGENAEIPDVPDVDGMKFVGWDGSFENVTEDRVINAIFESDGTTNTHTVTLVIAEKITTLTVKHGEAANIPATVTVEGYTFLGWDTDFSCVTSDITVTALLQPNEYIVTFVVDGLYYPITVKHGQTAVPPVMPTYDSSGNAFLRWDKELTNVTSNMTVNAVYETQKEYTVTFVVDGYAYPVIVKSGETAYPPFTPTTSSDGKTFLYWDKPLTNITADTVITAVFI